ncbi:MAG: hypothetical protein ABI821_13930 [Pseudomonadota bacterium]
MKTNFKGRSCVWLAALWLCATHGARACDVWLDEPLKVWRGNRNLTIDPKAPKVLEQFVGQSRWPPTTV